MYISLKVLLTKLKMRIINVHSIEGIINPTKNEDIIKVYKSK